MGLRAQRRPTLDAAVERIRRHGVLLVFPINNRQLPHSLWADFFPGRPMIWEWTEDGDARIENLWQLMKRLSDCRDVVYSKWYQGRATFFSRELFTAMVRIRQPGRIPRHQLSETARLLFEVLENNSPLSTKQLKLVTGLQGKIHEGTYSRAMKELFSQLLIVGFGEVDDGAFPSLAVGATELMYEDLWKNGQKLSTEDAIRTLDRFMPSGSLFRRQFDKVTPLAKRTEGSGEEQDELES